MLEIFIVSFIVALSGALSPGPLLTFTIFKSVQNNRGYIEGLLIILGHALLEFGLIMALLLGASIFLQNPFILTLIGILGSILLVYFGFVVIKDILMHPIDFEIQEISEENIKGFKGNSFIGGIFVSLSNPYWTLWWAVIGLSLMINFNISFQNPLGIILFFLGHEFGDLIWYIPISILASYGGRFINSKIYKYILIICGALMIFFGIFLLLRVIFVNPL
ncbi:MAG: LysE type translocator [Promethearchaeota archaeon]|nr:MAG: LysE type translocator [Candidatus Lokiarchaeota archaeon]